MPRDTVRLTTKPSVIETSCAGVVDHGSSSCSTSSLEGGWQPSTVTSAGSVRAAAQLRLRMRHMPALSSGRPLPEVAEMTTMSYWYSLYLTESSRVDAIQ